MAMTGTAATLERLAATQTILQAVGAAVVQASELIVFEAVNGQQEEILDEDQDAHAESIQDNSFDHGALICGEEEAWLPAIGVAGAEQRFEFKQPPRPVLFS
eukprot:TRINITY_DN44937_c0_g1_i1.p1 TRINITY_DN44937_c0_g1~~TRINITY_DN44937_c0_g1_i1.p1  ORF type:complete len:102 (-),score=24.18 TRINITY_DN44937_c0_g1_i1:178-483(-)